MSDKVSQLPKSRSTSLFAMATKVALREGKALFESQVDKKLSKMMAQADIIVSHVGLLKGAAMKAVQMITVEAQDLLPPEVLEILEKLQSQAPPLSNELMKELLKNEMGEDRFLKIQKLSKDPIASASIGQVYEAEINHEPVVIKIQYPDIAESVDSDLKILKKLLQTLLFVSRKNIDIDDLFEELKRVLKLETDYREEAKYLVAYHQNFESYKNYKIPKIYEDFCTAKVLVLSKEEGEELTDWIKSEPPLQNKEQIGRSLLDLYMKEFFENYLVQTDPNPANFLVNNKNQLILLDFGATVSYEKSFVRNYQSLLKTVFLGSDFEILNKIEQLGFVSSRESDEVKLEFVSFMKLSLLPFEKNQPFDFSAHEYPDLVRKKVLSFTKKLKYSAPPTEIIFLHRKLGGIFQLLRKLKVKIDLTEYRNIIMNLEIH